MSDEVKTVEVAEKPVVDAPSIPTVEDVKKLGWSEKEIESAEKRGMIQKIEPKKEEKPTEVPAETPEEVKPENHSEIETLVKNGVELTPDQEKEFLKNRPPGNPDRAFYFRAMNERKNRQRVQGELQKEREERAAERSALEARLAALEGKGKQVVDENGNAVDPEDKPMTVKEFKAMQKAEQDAVLKQQEEMRGRAHTVTEAQKSQEEYTRSIYPDFDEKLKLAAEVMQNIETMLPEKWKQAKAVKLIRDLQIAAANADGIDLDGYHGAMIAYEIGLLHPNHGKTPSNEERELKDPKASGGLTPEQLKRAEKNSQRGASSASIPAGGGRRTISVDEVTTSDLVKMDFKERQSFKQKHPDRYAKLVRG